MFAPFRYGLVVCSSAYIIAGKPVFRKCAILGSFCFFQRTDRDANFPQRHFGHVADGVSKDSGNVRRIKVPDMAEIKVVLIDGGIITAAHQQHISDTASHGAPELHLDIEFVQILQQTAFCIQGQLPEIVRDAAFSKNSGKDCICSLGIPKVPDKASITASSCRNSIFQTETVLPA